MRPGVLRIRRDFHGGAFVERDAIKIDFVARQFAIDCAVRATRAFIVLFLVWFERFGEILLYLPANSVFGPSLDGIA